MAPLRVLVLTLKLFYPRLVYLDKLRQLRVKGHVSSLLSLNLTLVFIIGSITCLFALFVLYPFILIGSVIVLRVLVDNRGKGGIFFIQLLLHDR